MMCKNCLVADLQGLNCNARLYWKHHKIGVVQHQILSPEITIINLLLTYLRIV